MDACTFVLSLLTRSAVPVMSVYCAASRLQSCPIVKNGKFLTIRIATVGPLYDDAILGDVFPVQFVHTELQFDSGRRWAPEAKANLKLLTHQDRHLSRVLGGQWWLSVVGGGYRHGEEPEVLWTQVLDWHDPTSVEMQNREIVSFVWVTIDC